jgi:hypothetical protein
MNAAMEQTEPKLALPLRRDEVNFIRRLFTQYLEVYARLLLSMMGKSSKKRSCRFVHQVNTSLCMGSISAVLKPVIDEPFIIVKKNRIWDG